MVLSAAWISLEGHVPRLHLALAVHAEFLVGFARAAVTVKAEECARVRRDHQLYLNIMIAGRGSKGGSCFRYESSSAQ